MATENPQKKPPPEPIAEPRGFGQRTRGLAGEYAHEQGWGLDVEERTKLPRNPQDTDGGSDYDYSARDFGDDPVNMEISPDDRDQTQAPATESSARKGEQR